MSKLKNRLKNQAENDSVLTALIVLLIFLLCVFFPLPKNNIAAQTAAAMSLRFVFSAVAIVLGFAFGFHSFLRLRKISIAAILVFLAALLVAAANFPIIETAQGKAVLNATAPQITLYIFFCLSVALFEELFFRGLILPLLQIRLKGKRGGGVLAVIVSSAVFGVVHLLNIFSGASVGGAFMQAGYTFTIGLLCGTLFLVSKSVVLPVIIHFLYDIGGLLTAYDIIKGQIWTNPSIIIMIIAAVLAVVICPIALNKTIKSENIDSGQENVI